MADSPRLVAYELLRAVAEQQAYANLVLPSMIRERRLSTRDAALATEVGYGSLRAQGTLDAVIAACVDRDLSTVDGPVLDLLRLGAYQALRTRIPRTPRWPPRSTWRGARATGAPRAS